MPEGPDRRRFLALAASAGTFSLGGCDKDRIAENPRVLSTLDKAALLSRRVQRLIVPRTALAREFGESDIAPLFRPNGSIDPHDSVYRSLAREKFASWSLPVGGMVETPLTLSLADLRALPARTQITRHDCVEGWSCIGKWTGVPLAALLERARPTRQARFVVIHCFDSPDVDVQQGGADQSAPAADIYYESIDFIDAFHPQTILAYALNGADLPVANGAPLRLRVERQLGYKMAKYIKGIELVSDFAHLGGGRGGYWEDRGYEWYAGI